MVTLLSRNAWAKITVFFKKWHFLLQNVLISDFLAWIRNQHLRIDPCAKFQLHWTKNKGTLILTSNNSKNSLMMSYLCRYQFDWLPSPQADCWATNFSIKIPTPRTAFQCKTLAPGSKNETKIPTPGHNLFKCLDITEFKCLDITEKGTLFYKSSFFPNFP